MKQPVSIARIRRGATVIRVIGRKLITTYVLHRASWGPIELREIFEELGGAWLKLGQALALRFDMLPEAYCYELFRLLYQIEAAPYAPIKEVIKSDFSNYPEELFASFEPEAFASASIGQVHRAVLHSGERVAVKVQRPDSAELIRTDIWLIRFGAALANLFRIVPDALSRGVITEFERWTHDELDYRVEARHAQKLAENASADPFEYVPTIHWELTSPHVLTMELLEGVPLIEVFDAKRRDDTRYLEEFASAGHDLGRIARNISTNSLNQMYQDGYFHADLHPANLFVMADDVIGYVDFGIVGVLTEETRRSLIEFARCLYRGRVERAADELLQWMKPTGATNIVLARADLVQVINSHFMDHGVPEGSARTVWMGVLGVLREHYLEISSEITCYLKALITVSTVVEGLAPVSDVNRMQRKFYRRMFMREIPAFLEG